MIQLRNISKKFDRVVLDHISYDFEEGKLYLIRGVSGCGKTTLLNIIGGLETEYTGSYYFEGILVDKRQKQIENLRSNIGYIFQDSLLFSNLNILENLKFIYNDELSILKWSKILHVDHLLNKMPDTLSNGERQRFSFIRALLFDPVILLADEPTASLDQKNSKEIENILYTLRGYGKTIIVSTHDVDFCKDADEYIDLNYGKISKDSVKEIEAKKHMPTKKERKSTWKNDFYYGYTRVKKSKISTIVLYTMIVLISLCAISIKLHFSNAMRYHIYERYPVHMTQDTRTQKEVKEEYHSEIIQYDDYHFSDGNQFVYGLFDEKDSAFSIPNAISYGEFPKRDHEILVNSIFIKKNMGMEDVEKALHKKVSIRNEEFMIAGIITEKEEILEKIYLSNDYLNDGNLNEENELIMIPYKKLKEIGNLNDTSKHIFSIKDAMSCVDNFLDLNNYWLIYANEVIYGVDFFLNIFLLVIVALAIIFFLFMMNVIRMDMMHRRRELGYMRLFSVRTKRLHHIVMIDYLLKITSSFLIANLLYVIIVLFVNGQFSLWLGLTVLEWAIVIIVMISYLWILTKVAMRKILKKSIIELIHE